MPLRRLTEDARGKLLFWLLAGFIALTFYAINGNRHRAMEGQEAHDALCIDRAAKKRELRRSENYLKQKGDPIVIFGLKVPRATIAANVAEQQRDLVALSVLDCKEEP